MNGWSRFELGMESAGILGKRNARTPSLTNKIFHVSNKYQTLTLTTRVLVTLKLSQ